MLSIIVIKCKHAFSNANFMYCFPLNVILATSGSKSSNIIKLLLNHCSVLFRVNIDVSVNADLRGVQEVSKSKPKGVKNPTYSFS